MARQGGRVPAGAEETLPHSKGCDSLTLGRRRPPPAAAQLGTRRPRAGEFSNTPTDQPFSSVLPVGACQKVFALRRQCPGSDLCSGSRAVLKSQPPLLVREGCSTVKQKRQLELWPPECTQEPRVLCFLRLSRCQFCRSEKWDEPRGEGARASALTTTAVTGWPGT